MLIMSLIVPTEHSTASFFNVFCLTIVESVLHRRHSYNLEIIEFYSRFSSLTMAKCRRVGRSAEMVRSRDSCMITACGGDFLDFLIRMAVQAAC